MANNGGSRALAVSLKKGITEIATKRKALLWHDIFPSIEDSSSSSLVDAIATVLRLASAFLGKE
ncbi:hypothetical protein L484_026172 [Morus notabilis]|uniref:Uncharacterized protein n=1 Tax=Morus notabilis TaxID=981085 RepID=W9REB8_9ROSA|nr:hypothetical protein L484_026172 [Morus notabilis]